MDIKQMLEDIAPEIDEVAAKESVMNRVTRKRRVAWLVRGAAVAAVIVGFVAVAALASSPKDDPLPPAATSTSQTPTRITTTTTPPVTAHPPGSSVPPATSSLPPNTTVTPTTTVAPPPSTTTNPPRPVAPTPADDPTTVSTIALEHGWNGPVVPFGTDDGDGSGCTPGQTVGLPDGFWYVFDIAVSGDDGAAEAQFDLVCRYSDDERQAIYTPDEVIYDDSVVNESSLLRTIPFAADARIVVLDNGLFPWLLWGDAAAFGRQQELPIRAWLKVVDGQIVEVYQNFVA